MDYRIFNVRKFLLIRIHMGVGHTNESAHHFDSEKLSHIFLALRTGFEPLVMESIGSRGRRSTDWATTSPKERYNNNNCPSWGGGRAETAPHWLTHRHSPWGFPCRTAPATWSRGCRTPCRGSPPTGRRPCCGSPGPPCGSSERRRTTSGCSAPGCNLQERITRMSPSDLWV